LDFFLDLAATKARIIPPNMGKMEIKCNVSVLISMNEMTKLSKGGT